MIAWLKRLLELWAAFKAGKQAQVNADRDATLKVAEDAARIASKNAGLTDAQLRDKLRNPDFYRRHMLGAAPPILRSGYHSHGYGGSAMDE